MNEAYFQEVLRGGPIPGSSLTADPENPAPFERPPEYTNVHEASRWLFSEMLEEDNYTGLLRAMMEDIPIMDIAQVMLFTGFTEGKWDVNLMMMLVEPTAYMLLALAERAGVDAIIDRGEDEDEIDEMVAFGRQVPQETTEAIKQLNRSNIPLPFAAPEDMELLDELPTAEELNLEGGAPPNTGSLLMAPEREGEE